MPIPVIDLFAGPGGLGEGFSSLRNAKGKPVFKICLSIEKEANAHRTLELRSFYKQFPDGEVPEDYYRYIRGDGITREELFENHEEEAEAAKKEAWKCELSEDNTKRIDKRISEALNGSNKWVLIGGPPCQAYSLVGRARMRGENEKKFEKDHRHFLYREYLGILERHKPTVFIMENVKGLLSAKVKGENIFYRILKDLSSAGSGYQLYPLESDRIHESCEARDFIVHSERHGIPQARHRIFILGVSNRTAFERDILPAAGTIPMWDAICDLPKIRSRLSREEDSLSSWVDALKHFSSHIRTSGTAPDAVLVKIDEICGHLTNSRFRLTDGDEFLPEHKGRNTSKWLEKHFDWFNDRRLKGYCNHTAKSHMRADLFRYLYAACFAAVRKVSPKIADFPVELRPAHKNLRKAVAGEMFADRFRVQLKDRPATTIVSHIAKDGHYFIHPDPAQCRSLTVREAARLQTFPDNYFFEGGKTAQYVQVGNAVPPLLARQIAEIVKSIFR